MRVLFDTSILVAAIVAQHSAHRSAAPILRQAHIGEFEGLIAAHSLAELYAILTRLPFRPLISPATARQAIEHSVLSKLEVISLTEQDYIEVLSHLEQRGLIGGITYDALILKAAMKGEAERIYTLNAGDFKRIYPELSERIVSP